MSAASRPPRASRPLVADGDRPREGGPDRKEVEVAVGVLIRADGAFLLTSRPPGKVYEGYWEFPGGKVEPGETVEQALRRELLEEIGVTIGAVHPWRVGARRLSACAGAAELLQGVRVAAASCTCTRASQFAWQHAAGAGAARAAGDGAGAATGLRRNGVSGRDAIDRLRRPWHSHLTTSSFTFALSHTSASPLRTCLLIRLASMPKGLQQERPTWFIDLPFELVRMGIGEPMSLTATAKCQDYPAQVQHSGKQASIEVQQWFHRMYHLQRQTMGLPGSRILPLLEASYQRPHAVGVQHGLPACCKIAVVLKKKGLAFTPIEPMAQIRLPRRRFVLID